MANSATSFSRNGVSDWIVQRLSAVILGVYTLVLVGFLMTSGELTYDVWIGFMQAWPMQIFTLIAVLALVAHAWIGTWTVSTDYMKPLGVRMFFQAVVAVSLIACLIWTIMILWG